MPLKVVYFRSSTLVYFYINIDNYSDFAHFNLRFILNRTCIYAQAG